MVRKKGGRRIAGSKWSHVDVERNIEIKEIMMPHPIKLACLFATAIVLSPVTTRAGMSQDLPPPGLYRIDSESTVNQSVPGTTASTTQREDGSNGNIRSQARIGAQSTGERAFTGKGPVTHCVMPGITASHMAMSGANCKTLSDTQTSNGYVHKAQCQSGTTTVTVHKLGPTVWEYTTEVVMTQQARPDLQQMMAMTSKNGQMSAEQQAALGKMMQMQADANKQRAAAMAQLDALAQSKDGARAQDQIREAKAIATGAAPMMTAQQKQRWTRIGDSCGAVTN
jgi:hypothetical protein